MTEDSIGVDVSKDNLDVHRLSDGASARFANTSAGFRALAKWLGPVPPARVVYEPTGPYHAAFEKRFAGKLPLVKVNPLQARRFAQSRSMRAKTDKAPSRRCKHRLPGNGRKGIGADGGGLHAGA